MLTAVEVTNSSGATLRLPVADSSNGYTVRDIEGLDPVDATLTTSTLAQEDGAQAQNAQLTTRNITMKIGLEPNWATDTVQSLRATLYNYLLPAAIIELAFYLDGTLFSTISGQVESFANTMFSADPEVDISIICYNPSFVSPNPRVLGLETTSDTDGMTVNYTGTKETGIIFALSIDRDDLTEFVISNSQPDGTYQQMTVSGDFSSGDVVTINTIQGSKAVTLTRAGLTASLMYGVDRTQLNWISFKKGNNAFKAIAAGAGIPYTLTYVSLYGGL
jgi:hypothetical protein